MIVIPRPYPWGSPRGVFVPLFPSKIALCSHVPTHFRYLFPFVIFRILFPCSQKMANVPLFPSIFCQCSLVPQNSWETLTHVFSLCSYVKCLTFYRRFNHHSQTPKLCYIIYILDDMLLKWKLRFSSVQSLRAVTQAVSRALFLVHSRQILILSHSVMISSKLASQRSWITNGRSGYL